MVHASVLMRIGLSHSGHQPFGRTSSRLCSRSDARNAGTVPCVGQYVEHATRMSQHIMRCHHRTYKCMQPEWAHRQQRFPGYTKPSQCPHCAAKVKALCQHKCPVLAQIASMHTCLQQGMGMSWTRQSRTLPESQCLIMPTP